MIANTNKRPLKFYRQMSIRFKPKDIHKESFKKSTTYSVYPQVKNIDIQTMTKIYFAIIATMISGQAFGKTTTLHCHVKADLRNYDLFIEIDEEKKSVTELINGDSENRLLLKGNFSSSTIKWEVTNNFGAFRQSVKSSLDRKTLSLLKHLEKSWTDNREPSAEFFQKGTCQIIGSSNKL